MQKDYAPIALFAYRRPDHLIRTLDALRNNPEAKVTSLYVFSDAAKNAADLSDVGEVRRILSKLDGFAEIEVITRERNVGLAQNIIGGVTQILERHDRVIVLEDDLVSSPHFLRFMNDALAFYSAERRVATISGYCYPVFRQLPETFLVRASASWGWATWRDRWQKFNPDGRELLRQLQMGGVTRAFDFDGAIAYTQMLQGQIAGLNDSWAIRWYAGHFLEGALTLFPGRSLIQNIGNDGVNSTHTKRRTTIYDVALATSPVPVKPIAIEESRQGREAFREFFSVTQRRFSRARRIWRRLKSTIGVP